MVKTFKATRVKKQDLSCHPRSFHENFGDLSGATSRCIFYYAITLKNLKNIMASDHPLSTTLHISFPMGFVNNTFFMTKIGGQFP